MRVIVIIAASLLIGFSMSAQEVKKIKIEDAVDYIKNSDHPLIVSFWATWCAPCIHEIPWFQAAVEKYADKKPELVLVSLDFTESYPKKITDFVKKSGFKATFFWLDEKNADHFCPMIDQKWEGGIPATLFINNKKNYRKFFERQLTDRQVDIEVKALVDPPTP